MWTSVITIGKEHCGDLQYILSRLDESKFLSYATDESVERVFIHLAALCDYSEEAVSTVGDVLTDTFLCRNKLNFFRNNVRCRANRFANAALLGSLVGFDRAYEDALVRRTLVEQAEFSVEGIFYFRLKKLSENWAEICELTNHLLAVSQSDDDVYGVIGFLAPSEKGNPLELLETNGVCKLSYPSSDRSPKTFGEFSTPEENLVFEVARLHPSFLDVRCAENRELLECFSHITRLG